MAKHILKPTLYLWYPNHINIEIPLWKIHVELLQIQNSCPLNSPLCNLYHLKQIDNCLHLLSCCTNQHIVNLRINWHNKVVHAIATTLLMQPSTRDYTRIYVGNINDRPRYKNLPSWLLPCTCDLQKCKCPTCLCLDILLLKTPSPMTRPILPNPSKSNSSHQIYLL